MTTSTHNSSPPSEACALPALLVSEREACRILSVGRTTLFHLRTSGALKSVLIKSSKGNLSGRRLYPTEALRAYVEKLEAQADQVTSK